MPALFDSGHDATGDLAKPGVVEKTQIDVSTDHLGDRRASGSMT